MSLRSIKFLFCAGLLILSVSIFAQNYQSMNQSVMMQRQQTMIRNEMLSRLHKPNPVLTSLHSKFIVPKQRQIDGFNKLIKRSDKKIAEMEIEIETLKSQIGNGNNHEKNEKKLRRKQNWLNAIKKGKQKFQNEVSFLESQMAVSENIQK